MATADTTGIVGTSAGPMEAALNVQRAFMDKYGDPLEQVLSLAVYLIPVHEEDDQAGYWSQAVYSTLDLFNLYRTVLLRSPEALPVVVAASDGASRTQRLRLQYTVAAFLLRALRSVQVLLEMRAVRSNGLRAALRLCLKIELVKLALKLVMRSRTPFAFYVDEEALEATARGRGGTADPPPLGTGGDAGPEAFVGRRSGKTLPPLGGVAARAAGGGLAPTPAPVGGPAAAAASSATPRVLAAEALFHSRPPLHAWLLLRRGRGSWAAWSAALLLDACSLALLAPALRRNTCAPEAAEAQRRLVQLWWALARSPLYERMLRRPCEALDRTLRRIPVVNLFNFMELAIALQPFYFSTSAS